MPNTAQSNHKKHIGVIYARFSSHNQRDESIEQQVNECNAYAKANGIKIIEIYADTARSGRSDRRPQFQRLKNDAKKGTFGVILSYKSNRIARNMLNAMNFENEMDKLGIEVLYAKEEFGNNAAGRFALRTMMNVNQFFSENMGEDIKRNQADNALNCRANGPASYGYKTGKDGRFAIDEETAPIVQEIFSRIAYGDPFVNIANDLNARGIRTRQGNPWGKSSFATIIRNERYIGTYIFNDVRIEGGMPQIITKELFYKVQDVLKNKKNPQGRKRNNNVYALTGKLFCGECKNHMIGMSGTSKNGDLHHYYVCNEKRSGGSCTKTNVKRDYIEKEIARAIKEYVLQPNVINWIADIVEEYQKEQKNNPDLFALESRLKEVEKASANMLQAIEQGIITKSTKQRLLELESEYSQISQQIATIKAEFIPVSREEVVAWLESFKDGDINDKEYQTELIKAFLRRAYLFDDRRVKLIFDLFDDESKAIDFELLGDTSSDPLKGCSLNLSCESPKKEASTLWMLLFLVMRFAHKPTQNAKRFELGSRNCHQPTGARSRKAWQFPPSSEARADSRTFQK